MAEHPRTPVTCNSVWYDAPTIREAFCKRDLIYEGCLSRPASYFTATPRTQTYHVHYEPVCRITPHAVYLVRDTRILLTKLQRRLTDTLRDTGITETRPLFEVDELPRITDPLHDDPFDYRDMLAHEAERRYAEVPKWVEAALAAPLRGLTRSRRLEKADKAFEEYQRFYYLPEHRKPLRGAVGLLPQIYPVKQVQAAGLPPEQLHYFLMRSQYLLDALRHVTHRPDALPDDFMEFPPRRPYQRKRLRRGGPILEAVRRDERRMRR